MAAIGYVVDGKYEILKQIGKGGMSVVYLAMDKRLNKQWAIKEISKIGNGKNNEVVINSLLVEANLMKRLDHPALPRIVDIIDNANTIYIVMDYIEGESLDKILKEYGPQPEEIVLEWAKQLCGVLDYLHSQNPPIIYRDMKPSNVMLKPEGNLKVIDFGVAREYKENSTADTTVLGTKGYASPEHYGARQTDARSDIYTLGMTLHHLITGVDPRPADYRYASVRQWNPDLSDGIEAIIDKCTALDPENRYQNCTELMYDLQHPDLITKDYKKEQIHKLAIFSAAAILSIVIFIAGCVCRIAGNSVNNRNYDMLISVMDSTSYSEKVQSYKKAIEIYPYDARAYIRLLEAYEAEGMFGKKENDELLALYNLNKDGFQMNSIEIAELNYKIGMMYFNYYTDENGKSSFMNRVQKAFPFFEINYGMELNGFQHKELCDCYYQICSFYKKYIFSSITVEEASKNSFEELFLAIEESLNNISGASAYDQLSLYNGVFMLLYDQRTSMASVNVDEQRVLDLLDKIYQNAEQLSVQKEQSRKLRTEITDYYEDYRTAIQRTYSNTDERK